MNSPTEQGNTDKKSWTTPAAKATVVVNEGLEPPEQPMITNVIEISPSENGTFKGTQQPLYYRDVAFARAFWMHLAGLVVVACLCGFADYEELEGGGGRRTRMLSSTYQDEHNGVLFLVIAGFMAAAALATAASLRIMMYFPQHMVQLSFLSAPVVFGLVAVVATADSLKPNDDYYADTNDQWSVWYLWVITAGTAAISWCLFKFFKRFIPFVSTTLRTAVTALKRNVGLYILAFGMLILFYIYAIVWYFSLTSLLVFVEIKTLKKCENKYGEWRDECIDDENDKNGWIAIVVFYVLFLFWTQQVVNIIHTTTSGVVGTWWFGAGGAERGCSCASNVTDSFHRATTYSFGSICFGSILVAIMKILDRMSRSRRSNILSCIIQCLLSCLRSFLEYFTSWAFCYIGIYGYSYLDAGKSVARMFRERGWTTFVSDRMIFRVLFLANLGTAAVAGLICLLGGLSLGAYEGVLLDGQSLQAIFWIGFLVGFFVSNTVLFVVESAVRNTIVLMAESANELENTYPDLYADMKGGWAQSYPEEWDKAGGSTPIAPATPIV